MKRTYEFYKDNQHRFDFVMDFGLDFCIVYDCEKDEELFANYLETRARKIASQSTDEELLTFLGYPKQCWHRFGRLTEASFLIALLKHFEDNDDIAVYPKESFVFSLFMLDPKYGNVYCLRSKCNDINA